MQTVISNIGSILLYGTAGFSLYMLVLNRWLILIPDRRLKGASIVTAFFIFVGSAVIAGSYFPGRPWVLVPLAIIFLVLMGEIRRLIIRKACTGSLPIDTVPHAVNLSSPITTTDLVCHRYQISLPNWRGPSFRIVQITDTHVNSNIPMEYYKEAMNVAEAEQADFAFFTGDYLSETRHITILDEILRQVARQASFAVLGNHDYWTNPDAVQAVIKEKGITMLSNESKTVSIGEHKICITGYDHPWGTKDKIITKNSENELHLVLSHTPDNIYKLAGCSADAVFSGHYHAGQIRLPVLGPIVIPSIYGRRFDHGHFVVKGTHLFVPSGIGAAKPPFRLYCKPDIFVIEIKGKTGEC